MTHGHSTHSHIISVSSSGNRCELQGAHHLLLLCGFINIKPSMNPSSDTGSAANTVIELKRAAHSCSMQALEFLHISPAQEGLFVPLAPCDSDGDVQFNVHADWFHTPKASSLDLSGSLMGKCPWHLLLGTSLLAKTISPSLCRLRTPNLTLAKGSSSSAGHHRNQINLAGCRANSEKTKNDICRESERNRMFLLCVYFSQIWDPKNKHRN